MITIPCFWSLNASHKCLVAWCLWLVEAIFGAFLNHQNIVIMPPVLQFYLVYDMECILDVCYGTCRIQPPITCPKNQPPPLHQGPCFAGSHVTALSPWQRLLPLVLEKNHETPTIREPLNSRYSKVKMTWKKTMSCFSSHQGVLCHFNGHTTQVVTNKIQEKLVHSVSRDPLLWWDSLCETIQALWWCQKSIAFGMSK